MERHDMMNLTFIPQWGRGDGAYSVNGDTLTINGSAWDFAAVPEGGEAHQVVEPGEDHVFIGPIRRLDGVIHATLLGWLGEDAPQHLNPDPVTVAATHGPVIIPAGRVSPQPEPGPE
jgi:hypothetical protein